MTQTDDVLKPCPFCGSPAAYRLQSDEGQQNDYDTIGCTACPAEMWRLLGDMDRAGDHIPDLTEEWNRRADLATQPDPLADPRVTALINAALHCRELLQANDIDRIDGVELADAAIAIINTALAAFDTTGGKDE